MHRNFSLLLSHESLEQHGGQFTGLSHIALPHLIPQILFTATMFPNKKKYVDKKFFLNDGYFDLCNDRSFTMLK